MASSSFLWRPCLPPPPPFLLSLILLFLQWTGLLALSSWIRSPSRVVTGQIQWELLIFVLPLGGSSLFSSECNKCGFCGGLLGSCFFFFGMLIFWFKKICLHCLGSCYHWGQTYNPLWWLTYLTVWGQTPAMTKSAWELNVHVATLIQIVKWNVSPLTICIKVGAQRLSKLA
jgi:hypothetical protein